MLVERLSVLDEASLRQELGRDPSHAAAPVLNDAQIADLFARRSTVLSYIAALIEARGEDEVRVFP